MVEYEILTNPGDDYNCNVVLEGERAELSTVKLNDCDLEAKYVEPLVEGFEVGSGVKITIYQGEHERDSENKRSKIASKGGNSLGSVGIRFNTMDNDAELYHLLIDGPSRGNNLATILFSIFVGMCEIEGVETIRMNIGGGEDTIGWLSKMGVPESDMSVEGKNLARVHTNLGDIEYEHLDLEVNP